MSTAMQQSGPRRVQLRGETSVHCTNKIRTTRFTLLTFLPLDIFWQFTRFANMYFLIIAILQSIKEVSLSLGIPTILLPLGVVIFATMLKDAYEDWHRNRSDSEINHRLVEVLRDRESATPRWEKVMWKVLKVGDVVRVQDGEYFPADLVFLTGSDPEGCCFVETKNLDGETNLKPKDLPIKAGKDGKAVDLTSCNGLIECEPPTKTITAFQGSLSAEGHGAVPLTISNLLLRSTKLMNTEWVTGLVIYTGTESRAMMNTTATPNKKSDVDKRTNPMIIVTFTSQLALSLLLAALSYWWDETRQPIFWYFGGGDRTNPVDFVLHFLTAILLLQYMIPIAIYVSMEMVKVMQGLFIGWDVKMYDEASDVPAAARTSTLNEELGHVSIVFSDKTGTLTCNVMRFHQCCIGGKSYGAGYAAPPLSVASGNTGAGAGAGAGAGGAGTGGGGGFGSDGTPRPPPARAVTSLVATPSSAPDVHYDFYDPDFINHMKDRDSKRSKDIHDFLLTLALCHNVVVEWPDASDHSGTPIYRATSPDEAALVNAARHLGFAVESCGKDRVVIRMNGDQLVTYGILHLLEFSSARKRMSVVVRHTDGRLRLYSKGADNVMQTRLAPGQEELLTKMQVQTDLYAKQGLRTLFVCTKDLTEEQFAAWDADYKAASMLMEGRDEAMDARMEEIERDLTFVGVTAVEDRLQDGVPETIKKLQAANVQLWVLTGDKLETAIDIGMSCGLIERGMDIMIVDGISQEDVTGQLTKALKQDDAATPALGRPGSARLVEANGVSVVKDKTILESLKDFVNGAPKQNVRAPSLAHSSRPSISASGKPEPVVEVPPNWRAIVIDGAALSLIEQDTSGDLKSMLLDACAACASVVCCRMSPSQKAVVVKIVRERNPDLTTLAIGDGANDVPMIQSAHVGIGISGYEGLQAVCASDYAIGQFRFLQRLLLVHGRWSYRRNSKLILYIFYKCFAFVLCLVWFSFYTGFSLQQLYNDWSYQFYNTAFTALPIIAMGALDQDVGEEHAQAHPLVYQQGQKRLLFNLRLFIRWCLSGVWHSLILFFFPLYMADNSFYSSQRGTGLWSVGIIVYTCVVITVNLRVAMITSYHTWVNSITIFLSICSWFAFMLVLCLLDTIAPAIYMDMEHMVAAPMFYVICLITVTTALLRDWIWRCATRLFFPNPVHILQEKERIRRRSIAAGDRLKGLLEDEELSAGDSHVGPWADNDVRRTTDGL